MKYFVIKTWIAIISLILSLTLSACSNQDNRQTPVAFTTSPSLNYELLSEQFVDTANGNHIQIQYPRFIGNTNDFAKENHLLTEALADYLQGYGTNVSGLELDINYNVTYASNEIVSIVFGGTSNSTHAAYPISFSFSVNIIMTVPKIAEPSDIVEINEALAQKFMISAKKQNNIAIREYFQQFTISEAESILKQNDVYFYLTDNEIGALITIPHAIGDYVDLRIPKEDIGGV